jgi:hypothetical protein
MNPIWVGKFEVTAPRDNEFLEGNAGAFVWAAAQAVSAENLVARMEDAMKKLGLTVVESEKIEEVIDDDEFSDAVSELFPEARRNVESVVCGTWHRFKSFERMTNQTCSRLEL